MRKITGCFLLLIMLTGLMIPVTTQAQDVTAIEFFISKDTSMSMYVLPGHFVADYSAYNGEGLIFSNQEDIVEKGIPKEFKPGDYALVIMPYPWELAASLEAGDMISPEILLNFYLESAQADNTNLELDSSGQTELSLGDTTIPGWAGVLLSDDVVQVGAIYYLSDMLPREALNLSGTYAATAEMPTLAILMTTPDDAALLWSQLSPLLLLIGYGATADETFISEEAELEGQYPADWQIDMGLIPSLSLGEDADEAGASLDFEPGQFYLSIMNGAQPGAIFEPMSVSDMAVIQAGSLALAMPGAEISYSDPIILQIDGRKIGIVDIFGDNVEGSAIAVNDEKGIFLMTYLAAPGTAKLHFLTALNIILSLENLAE